MLGRPLSHAYDQPRRTQHGTMCAELTTASSLVGVVLEGGYRVDGFLCEGGMGAVYRATHLRLEKAVAIKVLAQALTGNAEYLSRFRREALITGGLGHTHILQVFHLSTTPTGEPFLVMELLEGEDLDRRLSRVSLLSPADTVQVIKQIAGALAATHAKGIVHRDLKPANIFLMEVAGEDNFVKVLDFGISKMRAATNKLNTRVAGLVGEFTWAMVVRAAGGSFRHRSRMNGGHRRRKVGQRSMIPAIQMPTIMRVFHLHP